MDDYDAPTTPRQAVNARAEVLTPRALTQRRVRGRALAARAFAMAQSACSRADHACSDAGVARLLGLRSPTTVFNWSRAESGLPIHLGDVLSLPLPFARDVLVRCLGALETGSGPAPRDTLAQIVIELGEAMKDLTRDMADGRMDSPDVHRAHLVRISSLALRGYLALGGEGAP